MRARGALAWFDPRGRLSAPDFRRRLIRLLLTFFGCLCAAIWLASLGLRLPAILAFAGTLPVALSALAQTNRRLHDRDRSGWWLGLYLALEAVAALPLDQAVETHPISALLLVAALLAYFAWFCIETLLRAGTPGPNRYGPAPDDALG